MISDVTTVPALSLKVLFGSLIAPISSALWQIYFLTFSFCLSIVPFEVINAITPFGLTLSKVFPKEIIVY